jgi:hypothetical protein
LNLEPAIPTEMASSSSTVIDCTSRKEGRGPSSRGATHFKHIPFRYILTLTSSENKKMIIQGSVAEIDESIGSLLGSVSLVGTVSS